MALRYLKYGLETSYGSGASTWYGLKVTGFDPGDISHEVLYEESIESYEYETAIAGPLAIDGGTVDCTLRVKQLDRILEAVLGTRALSGSASSTATYTISHPKSLAFQAGDTSPSGTTNAKEFVGVGITTCEFRFEPRDFVTVSLSWQAKDVKEASFAAPSYISESPMVFYNAVVKNGATTLAEAKSATLTIERNLETDTYMIGGRYKTRLRGGRAEISGELTFTDEEFAELKRALYGSDTGSSTGTTLGQIDLEINLSSSAFVINAPVTIYESASYSLTGRDESERRISFRGIGTDFSIVADIS